MNSGLASEFGILTGGDPRESPQRRIASAVLAAINLVGTLPIFVILCGALQVVTSNLLATSRGRFRDELIHRQVVPARCQPGRDNQEGEATEVEVAHALCLSSDIANPQMHLPIRAVLPDQVPNILRDRDQRDRGHHRNTDDNQHGVDHCKKNG